MNTTTNLQYQNSKPNADYIRDQLERRACELERQADEIELTDRNKAAALRGQAEICRGAKSKVEL